MIKASASQLEGWRDLKVYDTLANFTFTFIYLLGSVRPADCKSVHYIYLTFQIHKTWQQTAQAILPSCMMICSQLVLPLSGHGKDSHSRAQFKGPTDYRIFNRIFVFRNTCICICGTLFCETKNWSYRYANISVSVYQTNINKSYFQGRSLVKCDKLWRRCLYRSNFTEFLVSLQ